MSTQSEAVLENNLIKQGQSFNGFIAVNVCLNKNQLRVPKAHSAAPLNKTIVSEEPYVWPFGHGKVRGSSHNAFTS